MVNLFQSFLYFILIKYIIIFHSKKYYYFMKLLFHHACVNLEYISIHCDKFIIEHLAAGRKKKGQYNEKDRTNT